MENGTMQAPMNIILGSSNGFPVKLQAYLRIMKATNRHNATRENNQGAGHSEEIFFITGVVLSVPQIKIFSASSVEWCLKTPLKGHATLIQPHPLHQLSH